MNKPKKPAVIAKTAPKKRGRPVGSKNKIPFPAPEKPVDWETLAKRLQEALAAEMRECDQYKKLFEDMQANSKPVRLLSVWQRIKLLVTGTY